MSERLAEHFDGRGRRTETPLRRGFLSVDRPGSQRMRVPTLVGFLGALEKNREPIGSPYVYTFEPSKTGAMLGPWYVLFLVLLLIIAVHVVRLFLDSSR